MKLSDLSDTALAGLIDPLAATTDGAVMRSLLQRNGVVDLARLPDSAWFGLVNEVAAIRRQEGRAQ